jgi:glycosyltransferase involved in cell wall biosynthesis
MHVVIVADHGHINGGQAKVAIDSAIGLARRGHRVSFFVAVGPVDPRLAEAGVETTCLGQFDIASAGGFAGQMRFLAQTMWNGEARRKLAEALSGLDPQETVVHVHAWAKALSPSIGRAIQASRLAAVYTMHEFFLVCPNGGFYDYPRAEPCRRVPMSMDCITTNCDARTYPRKVMRLARHMLLDHASAFKEAIHHFIMISDLQMEAARPYMPATSRFHRVANPIDVEDLGPKPGSGADFLYVGRLSTEKGPEFFLEAARRAGISALMAGYGPQGDELRARYPEARFLGWQSPDQVRALMRACRALVFPSVWYEGQPLTVYEALAMGAPVIVSDVCAGREAVVDGETGLWFRSQDADNLADALKRMSDDDLAARMTRHAYERYWAAPLTIDRHLDAIEEVYRSALADRPTAS